LRKELTKGEEVVWVGRPVQEIRVRKARTALIVGIVLCVVALGVVVAGFAIGQVMVAVVGFVLLPFSILFMLVPYLVKRFAAGREVYLVTPRRVVLYPPLRSYDRRQLHNKMELRESSYQEGAGSLIFEIEEHIEAKSGMQRPGQKGFERHVTEHGFKD